MPEPTKQRDATLPTNLSPAELVQIEADALSRLANRLDGPSKDSFERVALLLAETVRAGHRVILTGVGKSGLIARKIAATFVSTGTKAHFLHPGDALHGDLGILGADDVIIALSYSGETEEILRLISAVSASTVTVVSFCGCSTSSLAALSTHVLDVGVEREACAHQLAPTASTTVMLALGDALAINVSCRLQFQPTHFAELHPGGQLGRRLATVGQLMHKGESTPCVGPAASMPDLIHEMSAKRLGMTTIQSDGNLLGIISDGDLRRLLERQGPASFQHSAGDVMNCRPLVIAPDVLAADALALMERRKITALVVTEDGSASTPVLGVVHLHDLWEAGPK